MRHGLTLGELGRWFIQTLELDVEYRVIEMQDWQPDAAPGFGWPLGERTWINPSPNAPNLWMARAYAGTVMIEGTTLSEGRGTTRPLEVFGAPDIDARAARQGNVVACSALARWLPAARVLVRAYISQTCGKALPRRADTHRRSRLRSPNVPAVACPGARLQGDSTAVSGLPAVARFRLRIRARQARDRRHQRRPVVARMGRRFHQRHRRIWIRWQHGMNWPGRASVNNRCATEACRRDHWPVQNFSLLCSLPSRRRSRWQSPPVPDLAPRDRPEHLEPAIRARDPHREIARGSALRRATHPPGEARPA